nr:glycosyltransferase family 4 protein [Propionibacterium sp.]
MPGAEPRRIVHAVRSDGFAGVERYVALLAAEQARRGHRVTVIGGGQAAMAATVAGVGVRLHPAVTTPQVVRHLNTLADADVLHVHMTAAEAAAVLAVRAWRVPVVATRHFAARRGRGLGGRLMAPLIRRRLAVQIAISDYVAAHIDGASVVVRSGVPIVEEEAGERDRTILLAQRLEPEKGGADAVRAFAASGLLGEGWSLLVAGDGAQRPALERLAGALGVAGGVRFLGQRGDVGELMLRAGVLIAPCPIEGLGLTALEAMAAGLPVVAAGAGGHLETVGRVSDAALYAPGDAAAAAAQLRRLAQDADLRRDYGERLRAVQRRDFTVERQADAVEDVYRRLW